MMNAVAAPAKDITMSTPADAVPILTAEAEAFVAALRALHGDDWAKPTDCPGWTVQDVAAHVLGQWEGAAKLRTFLRRHRVGHRRHPEKTRLAAMNQQQVDELASLAPAALIDRLVAVGPKSIRAMRRVPGFVRRLSVRRFFPEDPLPDPSLGYIYDVIAARDTWMHRVDIATATGRPMVLAGHDKEIVAQTVRDLGLAWQGPAVVLELTGPAGGSWTLGDGSPVATTRADAVGYLRTLAGRDDSPALEVDGDQTVAEALRAARGVF
jgi:uncharacterized protein (TIGR03083 family)